MLVNMDKIGGRNIPDNIAKILVKAGIATIKEEIKVNKSKKVKK